jgi:hypothetical protein
MLNKKQPIPNELKITFNTSVPGFQNIRYTPNMTLPELDKKDNTLFFNPLVKYQESVIRKLPKDIQLKQFFSKGLFQSLLNSHGLQKSQTLFQATRNGNIDNNIRVTLDILFPVNSVITLGKQKYVIGDVQWTRGDWKIDKKTLFTPRLDSSQIVDPYLYNSVIRDEMINGEEELKSLSDELLYGANFPDSAKGIEKKPLALQEPANKFLAIKPLAIEEPIKPLAIEEPIKPLAIEEPIKPLAIEEPIKPLAIEEPNKPLAITNEDLEQTPVPNEINTILNKSKQSTEVLQNYFKNSNYYSMINILFQKISEYQSVAQQKWINTFLLRSTGIQPSQNTKNFSQKANTFSIENTTVVKNDGGGDCFFYAISQAIQCFHSTASLVDSITYGNIGTKNFLFTVKNLRELVSDYVATNERVQKDGIPALLDISFDTFMSEYNNSVKTEEIANQILYSKKEYGYLTIQQPFDINNPVRKKTIEEIADFIKTKEYWADQIAYDAILTRLRLNIITIGYKNGKIIIPNTTLTRNTKDTKKEWDKYVFLFYNELESHYELITFDYNVKYQNVKNSVKTTKKDKIQKFCIFQNNTNEIPPMDLIIPPLYMLFYLFGTEYLLYMTQKETSEFMLLPEVFRILGDTFEKMYSTFFDRKEEEKRKEKEKEKEKGKEEEKRKEEEVDVNNFFVFFRHFFHIPKPFEKLFSLELQLIKEKKNKNVIKSYYGTRSKKNMALVPFRQTRKNRDNEQEQEGGFYRPVSSYAKTNELPNETSNISYYITIDVELKKGTSLTPKEINETKCRNRWNAIRKAYANFRGMPYTPLPMYQIDSKKGGGTRKNTIL